MKFFKLFLLLSLCLFVSYVSPAEARNSFFKNQTAKQIGVTSGIKIPHDLSGIDQNEQEVNFDTLTGENGILLFFVRSASWCRHCIFHLETISKKGSILEDAGYKIVVVSNDSPQKLARFSQKHYFTYPMIADEDSAIIKAFGLMNSSYAPGTMYYGSAHPAIYVIDNHGVILDKYFNEDFREFPKVDEMRAVLDVIAEYKQVIKSEK